MFITGELVILGSDWSDALILASHWLSAQSKFDGKSWELDVSLRLVSQRYDLDNRLTGEIISWPGAKSQV